MRYVPILFSTPMVKAILDGSKNQTRRKVKFKKKILNPEIGFTSFTPERHFSVRGIHENGEFGESFSKTKAKTGDIFWVRETWQHTKILGLNFEDENYGIVYKASKNGNEFEQMQEYWKWKPSIFMPKEACRIFLEVSNVRVERLLDISEEDARNEGIEKINYKGIDCWKSYSGTNGYSNAKDSFNSLWTSINGRESLDSNPWVWVYDFKQIDEPESFR